jgi:hypothetical protein
MCLAQDGATGRVSTHAITTFAQGFVVNAAVVDLPDRIARIVAIG